MRDAMRIVFCCTDTRPEPWLATLRSALPDAEVSLWQAEAPVREPAEVAVVWSPPQAFIDSQPGLKLLFNIGAGVDGLLRLRLPAGLEIVRLDDAGMAVQMAEYVCHAVIRHFREFDRYQQAQTRGEWVPRPPHRREDFAVGVMGLGVLGSRVAQALRGFEFPVLGWSRSPKVVAGVRTFHGPGEGFQAFLAQTRVLVNLLPLTPDTRDLLDRDTLGRLRPGGYLINVARGAHLVEEDLFALLDGGHLSGATLDVCRTEPLPADHPFWSHPLVTLTPHTSARTLVDESVAQIAAKLRARVRGLPIAGVVDRGRGY